MWPTTRTRTSGRPLSMMGDDPLSRLGRIAGDKVGGIAPKTSNPLAGGVGGAVVGGLLLGPFGALFGSQIGSSMAQRE